MLILCIFGRIKRKKNIAYTALFGVILYFSSGITKLATILSNLIKTMKNYLLKIFAIIGIVFFVFKVVTFFQRESTLRKYWKNCEKVKIGMTLDQVREIVGDKEYQYWSKSYKSGSIILNTNEDIKRRFCLEYDMVFAGSDTPKIYFDPNTLLVTEIFLGE